MDILMLGEVGVFMLLFWCSCNGAAWPSIEAALKLQISVIFHDSSLHICWKEQTFNILSDMSTLDIMVQVECWSPAHKPDLAQNQVKITLSVHE